MPEFEVTPIEVAQNLAFLGRELQYLTDGLADLERNMVEAREDYTLAYAKAYLAAGGLVNGKPPTVAEREARAQIATHDERLRAETCEQLVRQRRAQIATIGKRGEWGRSIGSIVKSEIELGKVR